jgi:lipopolysaccharide/colanic/teichoic acid biosynthesis glycosyltransferase
MSDWCNSPMKRAFDFIFAVLLMMVLFPVLVLVAVIVKITTPGPVLFRQERPGRDGRRFDILKFRTMYHRDEPGPVLTRSGDPRLTGIGRFLRKFKLDELPQLLNVVLGHMSFVGPRPQAVKLWRRFVDLPIVLRVRPGITGAATLAFRNEEELLRPLSSGQVEELYLKYLMPLKMQIDEDYLRTATWKTDVRVIVDTVTGVFGRNKECPEQWITHLPDFVAFQAEIWETSTGKSFTPSGIRPSYAPVRSGENHVAVPEIGD